MLPVLSRGLLNLIRGSRCTSDLRATQPLHQGGLVPIWSNAFDIPAEVGSYCYNVCISHCSLGEILSGLLRISPLTFTLSGERNVWTETEGQSCCIWQCTWCISPPTSAVFLLGSLRPVPSDDPARLSGARCPQAPTSAAAHRSKGCLQPR